MEVLVVVDMQNDFIDGSLGTKEAVSIVPKVADKIKNFKGLVLATREFDILTKSYLSSVRNLKQGIKLSFLLHKRIEISLLADCSILHDKDFIIAAKNRFL